MDGWRYAGAHGDHSRDSSQPSAAQQSEAHPTREDPRLRECQSACGSHRPHSHGYLQGCSVAAMGHPLRSNLIRLRYLPLSGLHVVVHALHDLSHRLPANARMELWCRRASSHWHRGWRLPRRLLRVLDFGTGQEGYARRTPKRSRRSLDCCDGRRDPFPGFYVLVCVDGELQFYSLDCSDHCGSLPLGLNPAHLRGLPQLYHGQLSDVCRFCAGSQYW